MSSPRPSYVDYLDSLSKKQLMVMLARARQDETQGIGVIGMGCRFPGDIDTPAALWNLVREGRQVPTAGMQATDSLGQPRWNLHAPDLAPVAEWLSSGAYLKNIDLFDAEYFGLSDDEARTMDPQQRLLLEVSIQALADANLSRASLRRERVGIFIGTSFMEYGVATQRNGMRADQVSAHMLQGNTLSAASGRLGLMLGVSGPAMTLDTASSSALSAVHLAMQALRRRDCDLALVGACHLLLAPFTTLMLARGGALSPSGESRPFSARADGHVRGEGCGVFVLKRLTDCLSGHDPVYAVLRGSAIHQHGDRLALSVASAAGQKEVIALALRNADVDPLDVQYVEAQANGSQLGGAVEAEAMAQAYGRAQRTQAPPLYTGSCKANLGYLEIASGAPALMKTVLALSHGEIPPHRGAHEPDPRIGWRALNLHLPGQAMPWPTARRLAGVSGFGMNGINAHVVVEAAPAAPDSTQTIDAQDMATLLVLSAHNETALRACAKRLHAHLLDSPAWSVPTVCRTLMEGRDHLPWRFAQPVRGREEVLQALQHMAGPRAAPTRAVNPPGLHLLLPGAWPGLAQPRVPAPLWERMQSHARAMGIAAEQPPSHDDRHAQALALAGSLACLDMLQSLGIPLHACGAQGPYRHTLLQRLCGHLTSAQVCDRWREQAPDMACPDTGWRVDITEQLVTMHHRDMPASRLPPPFTPLPCDTRDAHDTHDTPWIDLLAARFEAGDNLLWSAWFGPRGRLMRLPGPVLTGRRHWPEVFRWS